MNKLYLFFPFFVVVSLSFFLTSCSKNEQESTTHDIPMTTEDSTKKPDESVVIDETTNEPEGLKLMKTSDCLACHQQDDKIVGPSFKMIKEKYTLKDANVKSLTDKVMKGSVGVWGPVAMPGHVNLKKEAAEKMIRYILSL